MEPKRFNVRFVKGPQESEVLSFIEAHGESLQVAISDEWELLLGGRSTKYRIEFSGVSCLLNNADLNLLFQCNSANCFVCVILKKSELLFKFIN